MVVELEFNSRQLRTKVAKGGKSQGRMGELKYVISSWTGSKLLLSSHVFLLYNQESYSVNIITAGS